MRRPTAAAVDDYIVGLTMPSLMSRAYYRVSAEDGR